MSGSTESVVLVALEWPDGGGRVSLGFHSKCFLSEVSFSGTLDLNYVFNRHANDKRSRITE